jgi:hypothetical protein
MGISWSDPGYRCLECGARIEEGLAHLGSVLCHDCRDELGIDAVVVHGPVVDQSEEVRAPTRRRFWAAV